MSTLGFPSTDSIVERHVEVTPTLTLITVIGGPTREPHQYPDAAWVFYPGRRHYARVKDPLTLLTREDVVDFLRKDVPKDITLTDADITDALTALCETFMADPFQYDHVPFFIFLSQWRYHQEPLV